MIFSERESNIGFNMVRKAEIWTTWGLGYVQAKTGSRGVRELLEKRATVIVRDPDTHEAKPIRYRPANGRLNLSYGQTTPKFETPDGK